MVAPYSHQHLILSVSLILFFWRVCIIFSLVKRAMHTQLWLDHLFHWSHFHCELFLHFFVLPCNYSPTSHSYFFCFLTTFCFGGILWLQHILFLKTSSVNASSFNAIAYSFCLIWLVIFMFLIVSSQVK